MFVTKIIIIIIDAVNDTLLLLLFDYIMYHQDGRTAPHYAAENGHTKIFKLLLDRGVNVDTASKVCDVRSDRQMMTMCV